MERVVARWQGSLLSLSRVAFDERQLQDILVSNVHTAPPCLLLLTSSSVRAFGGVCTCFAQ